MLFSFRIEGPTYDLPPIAKSNLNDLGIPLHKQKNFFFLITFDSRRLWIHLSLVGKKKRVIVFMVVIHAGVLNQKGLSLPIEWTVTC